MKTKRKQGYFFVFMVASLMALVALSIDILLPVFDDVTSYFNDDSFRVEHTVLIFFIGIGIGQFVFGPLSDSIGRKTPINIGLGCFVVGSLVCLYGVGYKWFLVGRLIQGFGLSAPRILSISIVRDCFKGKAMARIMSMVMVVFIMVPIFSPLLGRIIVDVFGDWHVVLWFTVLFALVIWGLFIFRMNETLAKPKPYSLTFIYQSLRFIFRQKQSQRAIWSSVLLMGVFMFYISNSFKMFSILGYGDSFAYLFACFALSIGVGSILNGRVFIKYFEMGRIVRMVGIYMVVCSVLFGVFYALTHSPYCFMAYLFVVLFGVGILFGNLNAIAMEPLGDIAGMGATLIGGVTILFSVPISMVLEAFISCGIWIMMVAFGVLGGIVFGLMKTIKQNI